jgi:aspartate racemase
MKVIGIIGGVGPESTVDYYKSIITTCRIGQSLAAPEIIIYSINIDEVLSLVGQRDWSKLIYLLVSKIKALHRAGADFAAISANTPHIVFDEVAEKSPIPLISIVTATLEKTRQLGLKKVGLLGTKFTMQANFFAPPFAAQGMEVVVPPAQDQEYIHEKLMTEIELGMFTEETRQGLVAVAKRMKQTEQIEGIILGCTELPLILREDDCGIPSLNTTAIHVEAIVNYAKTK